MRPAEQRVLGQPAVRNMSIPAYHPAEGLPDKRYLLWIKIRSGMKESSFLTALSPFVPGFILKSGQEFNIVSDDETISSLNPALASMKARISLMLFLPNSHSSGTAVLLPSADTLQPLTAYKPFLPSRPN